MMKHNLALEKHTTMESHSHSLPPSSTTSFWERVAQAKELRPPTTISGIPFSSPLLIAPMSGISHAPFRLLMEELGAGGSISELVSGHGIEHGNKRTLDMLKIDPREKTCGLQLFGEDENNMAHGAMIAQDSGPQFIDINMGCPVRKVVTKGAGSALMQKPQKLYSFFSTINRAFTLPLTIKIRTGWDEENRNALEVTHIAHDAGVSFVSIHGRTRTQQYRGLADWDFIEEIAQNAPLPIIGNGDLVFAEQVKKRLSQTSCQALMIGRGALRDPFLFLHTFLESDSPLKFYAEDYYPVLLRYHQLLSHWFDRERLILIQVKKLSTWMASGMRSCAQFREKVFKSEDIDDVLKLCEDYFLSLGKVQKKLSLGDQFMQGGHG